MDSVESRYRKRVYEWKVLEWKDLSPYDILLLDTNCSDDDICKSYKFLSLKYHPDKNSSKDAVVIFQKISNAYDTISTPEKRSRHAAEKISKAFRELKEDYPITTTIIGIGLLGITIPVICVQACYQLVEQTYTSVCYGLMKGYNYLFQGREVNSINITQNDKMQDNIIDLD